MADYNIFTQLQTPAVPISLYADAATAGYKAGLTVPSKTTAIIEGLTEGIETGQRITSNALTIEGQQQQNIIRQNQVEQIPVANEMSQVQLENAQKINRINELRLKIEEDTTQLKIDTELNRLEEENAQFEEVQKVRATKDRISQNLVSTDLTTRRKILQDPEAMDLMLNDSKYGENVLGALAASKSLSKEEYDGLFERINFVRAKEIEAQKQKAINDSLIKELQKFDKLEEDVNASPQINNTLSAAGYKSYTDLIDRDYIAVPTGSVSYIKDEKTGEPTNVIDKYMTIKPYSTTNTGKPISYDIIIDGVKSPLPISSEDEVAKLNKIVNLSRSKFGMSAAKAAEKEAPVQTSIGEVSKTPEAPRSLDQIQESLVKEGFPEEGVSSVLDMAVKAGNVPPNWFTNILDLLPGNLVDATSVVQYEEPDAVKTTRNLINGTAAKASEDIMNIMSSKDSTKKQELRDWADANDVKLTETGLNKYFREKFRQKLSEAYDEAESLGSEQQQKAARLAADTERLKNRYKGVDPRKVAGRVNQPQESTMSGIINMGTNIAPKPDSAPNPEAQAAAISDVATKADIYNEASLVQMAADEAQTARNIMRESLPKQNILATLDTTLNTLQVRYGLPKDYVNSMRTIVTRIEKDGYLKNQDPHVKALAAIEGAGRMNIKSKTGVRGPLQVTKLVADMYKKDRFDPQENIEAGALYIEDLIKQFKGSRALAYAAYNAGPGVIRYAQKLAGGSLVWQDLKPYLLEALTRFRGSGGWKPSEKLKEVYNYPEKVMLYEEVFQGSIPDTGVIT